MSSSIRSLSLPILSDAHFYISGDVTLHPSAAIAPGVLLQADPGSRLVISAGVCIGAGCIVHAHEGSLVLEVGATLGTGVLIIGSGNIGINACVGSQTTIINHSVPAQQIVPPGSLLGDQSRQVVIVEASEPYHPSPNSAPSSGAAATASEPPPSPDQASSASSAAPAPAPESPPPQPPDTAPDQAVKVVYGRTYIERMMVTMFPHRQSTDNTP